MNGKHTPGPWTTDEKDHDAPYQSIRIRSAMHHTVCTVWIDDAPVHEFNAEQRTNARLIAAAPDLLEALQGIIEAEHSEGRGGSGFSLRTPTREHQQRVYQAWQKAHEAYAKATGEAALAQPHQEPWPEEPEGHIAGGVQPSKQTRGVWTERWYGSGPERGWWVVCGRDHIAHLGTEVSSDEVRKIVDAHNLTPPSVSKPWVGLTENDIGGLYKAGWANNADFARAIEAKLREKNGYN